ncbi:DUF397 domain-containing protein [Streptomyces sp. RerS4]|uniref:DUF397 domain-containing protein n=1 Tax=Streptomyces sp. RerS4 TaxID=2942449 RepID=UPI00201C6587|nr:DUF397 domain-containing protein [Streptomyces sp. RerS4]UQW99797.1 DUF397 domain-containing protein [Streptomyces sp. RerS4]
MAESMVSRPFAAWSRRELDLSGADWRSGSGGVGDVQIAFVEGFIAMRNGERPDGAPLVFAPAGWRRFVLNAGGGTFDR